MTNQPERRLPTFDNPKPERDYRISIRLPEFTCLCPLTGQPDFAHMTLDYIPAARCIELKGLKLYIWSFRDAGAFHEAITNQILDDIVAACAPRVARVSAEFNVRGGTYPTIIAEYRDADWQAAADSQWPPA
ncbi:MAG: preQ(1) synthase [Gammaproteobacteria bacterium]